MFVAAIEVKALDRARLLSDVARALSRQPRQHPRRRPPSPAPTASRRCASSSSSATPATSSRCCRAIKRIDSVYDAYRIVPGKGG